VSAALIVSSPFLLLSPAYPVSAPEWTQPWISSPLHQKSEWIDDSRSFTESSCSDHTRSVLISTLFEGGTSNEFGDLSSCFAGSAALHLTVVLGSSNSLCDTNLIPTEDLSKLIPLFVSNPIGKSEEVRPRARISDSARLFSTKANSGLANNILVETIVMFDTV
jgi:hypothetical protein